MFKNATFAFVEELKKILREGETIAVRGSETKEVRSHLIKIASPLERVHLIPGRNNNIFAQIAETFWVMAGRNDLEFLSHYLPRAVDFSDDGKVWRGGYGPRLRSWQGVDQIKEVAAILNKDPNSRRAVMVIFNPARDNIESKDIPCFTYDTLVHSPEGNIPIGEIPVGYPVYCYDEEQEKIVLSRVTKSGKTGSKQVWKVYLDDGSVIKTTENHLFMTKGYGTDSHNYQYIHAKSLTAGTRLIPIRYLKTPKGYLTVKVFPKKNTAWENQKPVHRMYWEYVNGEIPTGFVINHINNNKTNNSLKNLECISKALHDSERTAFQRIGKNNPSAISGKEYSENKKQRFDSPSLEELIEFGKEILLKEGKLTWRNFNQYVQNSNYRQTSFLHTFGSFGAYKSAVYGNHKVIKVEQTDEVIDVYDIEVDKHHNFFVGSGVLVHNCNNWLHFIIRNNRLHLNVSMRSNDIWWGFSGINAFEWSVLHEMMAYWTNTEVGEYSHFASSLHLYDRHYQQAEKIIANFQNKTLYDFGFTNPKFSTPLPEFERAIGQWFAIEDKMRQGKTNLTEEIHSFSDNLLRNSLQMLYIYNRHLLGDQKQEIARLLEDLPINDFKIGAIEYFSRKFKTRDFVKLQAKEREFFQYFWKEKAEKTEQLTKQICVEKFSAIFSRLSTLHYKKTLVYKDSWKKHGEVLGVFSNITRKYDRIEVIITEKAKSTADESLLDTVADLAVYATKYLTYLAEHYQEIFKDFIGQYQPIEPIENYCYNRGFDAVVKILLRRYESDNKWEQISNYDECFTAINKYYKGLEDVLINGDWRQSDPRKCSLTADLAISAMHYLVLASIIEPEDFQKIVSFIETL